MKKIKNCLSILILSVIVFSFGCQKSEGPEVVYEYSINVEYSYNGGNTFDQSVLIKINETTMFVILDQMDALAAYSYYYNNKKMDPNTRPQWDVLTNTVFHYRQDANDDWYRYDIIVFQGDPVEILKVKQILDSHNCFPAE